MCTRDQRELDQLRLILEILSSRNDEERVDYILDAVREGNFGTIISTPVHNGTHDIAIEYLACIGRGVNEGAAALSWLRKAKTAIDEIDELIQNEEGAQHV